MAKRTLQTRNEAVQPGPLPPLSLLRAFEATARTGSMRKAAEEVGLSHSAVSRHIQSLESWMGVKLMVAGPRGVTTSREGALLLGALDRAFRLIADAAEELRPGHRRGTLRIWCIPGFATRWLTPRLSQIERLLPGTDVVLRATNEQPVFSRGEADVFVGFALPDQIPAHAVRLIQPRIFPVASPSWLAANRLPSDLAELADLPLIHEESHRQWTEWLELAGRNIRKRLSGPRLSDASLGLDASLASQGIALVTSVMAAPEIDNGRIVELFETDIRLGEYFLLAPLQQRKNDSIAPFAEWLVRSLSEAESRIARSPANC